ncbi:MAG: LacI family DNA-binding transcriptional regulator [Opitutae bacterium]|nr:LacI family DNA-binding transcriptional regulator [Opitutae bacterium]
MGKIIAVTLDDIARTARVAKVTVSLALRDDPRVAAGTRARIQRIARKLGYRPHAAISLLMRRVRLRQPAQGQPVLAGITSWSSRPQERFSALVAQFRGASARARELGFRLEEFRLNASGMTPERLGKILTARHIEGVIVFPFPEKRALVLPWAEFAAVTVGYTLAAPTLNRVATAHYEAATLALRELQNRGYQRVGLVLERTLSENIERRWLAAFCAYQHEHRIPEQHAVLTVADTATDRNAFEQWLSDYRPDAILAGTPAPGRWLRQLGRSAPGDVGLAYLSRHVRPAGDADSAYIDDRIEQVGAAAVDEVVAQLHRNARGVPAVPHETFVLNCWVDGTSVRT